MPNAAASFDADFGVPSPARRKAPRPASARKSKAAKRRGGAMLNSMPRYGAIAISGVIGLGIIVNALMMQHGHHPAPLFRGTAPADAATPPAIRPKAEAPAARQEGAAAQALPAPIPPAHPPRAVAARTAPDDDPIARLLGGASAAAPGHKAKPAGTGVAKVAASKPAQAKHRKTDD